MKKQLVRISLLAMAAFGFFSCSQSEEFLNESSDSVQLNVAASSQSFTPAGGSTRVSDNAAYATVFEKGDAMGVYAIKTDGTVIRKNVKLEYDGSKWTAASPLYYYEDCDYVAYFPYAEEMSSKTITKEDDIKTDYTIAADQSTKAAYVASDLMTSTIASKDITITNENAALSFSFSHAFSMIEFNVPTYMYQTTDGYAYNAPLNVETFQIGGADVNTAEWYQPTAGMPTYRKIVAAGEYGLEAKIYDMVGYKPVSFSSAASAVAAGAYKGFSLTYTGAPSTTRVARDIQVGDYYYSDGSIMPCNIAGAVIPTANCVGLIFSTTTTAEEAKDGFKHGQVMALGYASQMAWIDNSGDATKSFYEDRTPQAALDARETEAGGYAAMNGYQFTITKSDYRALWETVNYGQSGSATSAYNGSLPEGKTTGWYLPSAKQFVDLMVNIGGKTDYNPGIGSVAVTESYVQAINKAFTNVNGNFLLSSGNVYWTSSECINVTAYSSLALDFGSAKYGFTAQAKTTTNKRNVRPAFAF